MAEDVVVVLCTVPTEEVGAQLARGLVTQKLAACVNLLPGVQSFYEWEGQINHEPEVQLVIKTARFAAVRDWLKQNHPYDEPEILALPVADGSPTYLNWVRRQSSG